MAINRIQSEINSLRASIRNNSEKVKELSSKLKNSDEDNKDVLQGEIDSYNRKIISMTSVLQLLKAREQKYKIHLSQVSE